MVYWHPRGKDPDNILAIRRAQQLRALSGVCVENCDNGCAEAQVKAKEMSKRVIRSKLSDKEFRLRMSYEAS